MTTATRSARAAPATAGPVARGAVPGVTAGGTTLEDLGRATAPRRHEGLPHWFRALLGPLSLLVLWAAVTMTGLVDRSVLPSPVAVATAGWELTLSGELLPHVAVSTARAMGGLTLGILIGTSVALVAGLTRSIEDPLDAIMQVLKAIPNFALLPLLIVWFGIGEVPKVTLVVLGVMVPMYIHTYSAIRGGDARLLDLASVLRLSRRQTITTIVLPGALPGFLTGLRISVTNAWLALIFAETINAPHGLGKLMSDARAWFLLDVMLLVITLYAVLGLLGYAAVRYLEHWLLDWRDTKGNR